MTSFLYFAYGSNMLTQRLTARCPGAVPAGIGFATDYAIGFYLKSADGSGKAGIIPETGSRAWGVLYDVPMSEQGILDEFEGVPNMYRRHEISINLASGDTSVAAHTYIPQPEHRTTDSIPFDWYRALCHGGARQHGLPESALNYFAEFPVISAPYTGVKKMLAHAPAMEALRAANLVASDGSLLA